LANNACGIFGGPISQHVRVRGRAAKSRPVLMVRFSASQSCNAGGRSAEAAKSSAFLAFFSGFHKNDFIFGVVLGRLSRQSCVQRSDSGCGAMTVLGWRQSAGILERNTSLQYDGLRERYIKRTVRRATIRLEDLGYAQLTVPQIPS
jgi:hypothetical protein